MKIEYITPDNIILDELGQRLARVRKQQGLTQTTLAQEAGLGVATLRRIESGQSGQMESWLKIMKALRMTAALDAFLPEKFDSPRAQVLSGKPRRKKPAKDKRGNAGEVAEAPIKWGDQTP
ncbi:MAG: transcriptional regulator with XRE-family HTH domain [Planctomycetota bacterium]|jgi:transcriptional regulator with XRE-family HTH domain